MAMLFITHDLGIVRKIADTVCVMKEGKIVEQGPVERVFSARSIPIRARCSPPSRSPIRRRCSRSAPVVVETDNLKVWFPIKRGVMRRVVGHIKAVDGVEHRGAQGRDARHRRRIRLGQDHARPRDPAADLVATARSCSWARPLQGLKFKEMRPFRRDMQIVFQDPYGSLSPRMSVVRHHRGRAVGASAAAVRGASASSGWSRALRDVGLDPETRFRYPHEFSGGQRQRIAVARAIVLEPTFVVMDEPTCALDMLIQSQIVDLLRDLQKRRNLTYLFISHDLRVVSALASRLIVMRNGKVVEEGPAADMFANPQERLHARAVRRGVQSGDRARGRGARSNALLIAAVLACQSASCSPSPAGTRKAGIERFRTLAPSATSGCGRRRRRSGRASPMLRVEAAAGRAGRFPNLEVIFYLGAGVDHLLGRRDAARRAAGALVDPDLTRRMTEYVVMHVLMHHRRQGSTTRSSARGMWAPKLRAGERVAVGVMGLGVLGRDAAEVLPRLGFRVRGLEQHAEVDPRRRDASPARAGSSRSCAHRMLVCLLPLTPATRGILNRDTFRRLARDGKLGGADLINAGRGGLQVEDDILAALDDGTLAGATLDVFPTEPLPADSPFWTHPKVTLSPHNAARHRPGRDLVYVAAADRRFERGEPLENVVDRGVGY